MIHFNKTFPLSILFVIGLMLVNACGRTSFDRSLHTVKTVIDGRTVEVENKVVIHLIGIDDTEEGKAYLEKMILGKKIKFVFDSEKKEQSRNKVKEFYGYIKTVSRISVNGTLLKLQLAGLNLQYLIDSLAVFQRYANGDFVNDLSLTPPTESVNINSTSSFVDLVKKIEPSVFLVITYKGDEAIGQGTGFFISNDGIGISNYHVFDGGDNWKIKCGQEDILNVEKIITYDQPYDFVIFKVRVIDRGHQYLKFASSVPSNGEEIFVIGNPRGLERTVTKGIVSAKRSANSPDDYLQIDAAISPGSSGSPVCNMKGEVVGVATMKRLDCEMCNFAINSQIIKRTINSIRQ